MSTSRPNPHSEIRTRRRPPWRTAARRAALIRTAVVVGTIGLIIWAGFSAAAVARPTKTKRAYTETLTGARISLHGASFESVYKVVSKVDRTGAAIQDGTFTATTFPLTGTETFTTYFANGVLRATSTFTLTAPDASGTGTITGSGKCVGGTGVHKREKCAFKLNGTYNSTTTVTNVTVAGTDTR